MLPCPSAYSGGFPPRDPRLPGLGHYPLIAGGQDLSSQVMANFEERHRPLKEIAYARTGRDAGTQASPEGHEMAVGPDEPDEPEPHGVLDAAAAGARHFAPVAKGLAYGAGALSGSAASALYHGVRGIYHGARFVAQHLPAPESDSELDETNQASASAGQASSSAGQASGEPRPAYLLDREDAAPRKRVPFIQKERTRIKEQAAMTGEHPFHPWRK